MRNKEQSDAITSGQYGPKLPGLGRAPTSGVCGLWPQRHCLPFSDTPENGAKKQRLLLANVFPATVSATVALRIEKLVYG